MTTLKESEDLLDSRLLQLGFSKHAAIYNKNTIHYRKGRCELIRWMTRGGCFYFLRMLSGDGVSDIMLAASNNHSLYRYQNIPGDTMVDWLCDCKDIDRLDMYLTNKETIDALEVLACR